MSFQQQIISLEQSIKEQQARLASGKIGLTIKDSSARAKFIASQKAATIKSIEDTKSRIEGLKAQILTEVEENPILEEKKTNPLLIPAIIIGALILS